MANTWYNKKPEDMTLDELKAAKNAVQADVDAKQADLAWRASINMALASEINSRFDLQAPGMVDPRALPDYPLEQATENYADL